MVRAGDEGGGMMLVCLWVVVCVCFLSLLFFSLALLDNCYR